MTTTTATFSRTDLTRKTREILELVRRGRPAVIQSYGEEQAVLVDRLDYRLLQGLAGLASRPVKEAEGEIRVLLGRYLSNEVSLSKVAAELGVSRFDLMERFDRLGVPIEVGPDGLDDARAEVEEARATRTTEP